MNEIVQWSSKERKELFELTADSRGMSSAIAEKDFWVCWVLSKLFANKNMASKIIFKGGTTLSKVFGVIERFSEDIDLILDWTDFIPEPAGDKRSRTKQSEFNDITNVAAEAYLRDSFLPMLNELIGDYCKVSIDNDKPCIINVTTLRPMRRKYFQIDSRIQRLGSSQLKRNELFGKRQRSCMLSLIDQKTRSCLNGIHVIIMT
jgi:hypothetical protein